MIAWPVAAVAGTVIVVVCGAVALRVLHARVSRLRRQQGLRINDHIVQGLARVKWALEANQPEEALDAADHTLAEAQKMVTDLLASDSPEGGLNRLI